MLIRDDEFGLLTGEIPYCSVKLTAKEVEEIKHKRMDFYSTDGKTLFEIRDKEGKATGEYMFFVIFR